MDTNRLLYDLVWGVMWGVRLLLAVLVLSAVVRVVAWLKD